MTSTGFRFLRPYLFRDLRPLPEAACRSHLRFHAATRNCKRSKVTVSKAESAGEVQLRAVALQSTGNLSYPRIDRESDSLAISSFRNRFKRLTFGESDKTRVVVRGRSHWAPFELKALVDVVRKGAVFPLGRVEAPVHRYSTRRPLCPGCDQRQRS